MIGQRGGSVAAHRCREQQPEAQRNARCYLGTKWRCVVSRCKLWPSVIECQEEGDRSDVTDVSLSAKKKEMELR